MTRDGDTVTISLAKALKVKNRLAGLIANCKGKIQMHNCVESGQQSPIDVVAEEKRFHEMTSALVHLKAAIAKSNEPIQADIFMLAEKKSQIEWYKSLQTQDGTFSRDYADGELTYVAAIKKPKVYEVVRQLEREIDDIQDKLDAFNSTTSMRLPASILAMTR